MPSPSPRPLTLIVAATASNGIGLNGGLPWRLPEEMKYFAKVTQGAGGSVKEGSGELVEPNSVIMGRKTWEGIPAKFRPLKGRNNLVVSRVGAVDLSDSPLTTLHSSLPGAISSLSTTSKSFLIGGSQLYTLALTASPTPLVDRILLTRIASPAFDDCDAFLHEFRSEHSGWVRASHKDLEQFVGFEVAEGEREERGVRYAFEMWVWDGKKEGKEEK